MIQSMIDIIINNLINVGVGIMIFLFAYLSNMCLGIYYNTSMLGQEFDWRRIAKSAIKIVAVGLGIILLTLAITLIIPFADANGLTIPDEYSEVIKVLAILATCLTAAIKYIIESIGKLRDILNGKAAEKEQAKEEIKEN